MALLDSFRWGQIENPFHWYGSTVFRTFISINSLRTEREKTENAIQNDTVIVSIRLFSSVRCAFYAISSKYCSIVNVHRNKDERRKQIKEHKIKLR